LQPGAGAHLYLLVTLLLTISISGKHINNVDSRKLLSPLLSQMAQESFHLHNDISSSSTRHAFTSSEIVRLSY